MRKKHPHHISERSFQVDSPASITTSPGEPLLPFPTARKGEPLELCYEGPDSILTEPPDPNVETPDVIFILPNESLAEEDSMEIAPLF